MFRLRDFILCKGVTFTWNCTHPIRDGILFEEGRCTTETYINCLFVKTNKNKTIIWVICAMHAHLSSNFENTVVANAPYSQMAFKMTHIVLMVRVIYVRSDNTIFNFNCLGLVYISLPISFTRMIWIYLAIARKVIGIGHVLVTCRSDGYFTK